MILHWPQAIVLLLMVLTFALHLFKHGEPREPYSAGGGLVNFALLLFLLWWGGFFA